MSLFHTIRVNWHLNDAQKGRIAPWRETTLTDLGFSEVIAANAMTQQSQRGIQAFDKTFSTTPVTLQQMIDHALSGLGTDTWEAPHCLN